MDATIADEQAQAQIARTLTLHPPETPDVGRAMDVVRASFQQQADLVIRRCPAGRERALALTALEEAAMRAIQAIACDQHDAVARMQRESF